jgi:prepilin peptidase CpaA
MFRKPMISSIMLHTILLSVAATALMVAAMYDFAVRIIPNGVSMIVAIAGLGRNGMESQLLAALFGAGLVFAGAWQCWRRGWIGGGDVKLLTACTLLVHPATIPELVVATALAGAVLALCYLALERLLPTGVSPRPRGRLGRIWRAERRRITRRLSLPYACAIAAGVVLTLCSPISFG